MSRPLPFTFRPAAAHVPVLVTVTHAARVYAPDLLALARVPASALRQLEDPLVDELASGVRETGAGLLVAGFPRAFVDLNRAPDDLEPAAVRGNGQLRPTARARIGLGVVPTRLAGSGALWRRPLTAGEIAARLDGAHAPFHDKVAFELARMRDAQGAAILLDLHSMPPVAAGADVVIGDRHGSSCDAFVSEAVARAAGLHGLSTRANDPYAGGYVVARHGQPLAGIHAVQVELSRALYLDVTGRRPGPGWSATRNFVGAAVRALADALAPPGLALAAE